MSRLNPVKKTQISSLLKRSKSIPSWVVKKTNRKSKSKKISHNWRRNRIKI
jgi:ribosomal protein L39E